ncbi:MAG: hypothetical protein MI865_01530, partial [Proteobacteria bacterium]|nr:hypothetical protein [Pseudomonadota bacterium]
EQSLTTPVIMKANWSGRKPTPDINRTNLQPLFFSIIVIKKFHPCKQELGFFVPCPIHYLTEPEFKPGEIT